VPRAPARATIVGMHERHESDRRVLVAVVERRAADSEASRIRHFRLARVPRHARPEPVPDRFAYLHRSHD